MEPLEFFRHQLSSSRVMQYDHQLVYTIGNKYALRYFKNRALNIIMVHRLPLVIETNEGLLKCQESTMVVKMAPESVEFRHEVVA